MNDQFFINRGSDSRLLINVASFLTLALLVFLMIVHPRIKDVSIPTLPATKAFPEVALKAKAAYVYDVRNQKVLFAKSEDRRLPLASLTKIMSALVAEDISPLYGTITISGEALTADGDSGLLIGEEWSLKNLLDFSLLTSSNDGMRAVALSLGALSRANATSAEIVSDFVLEMNNKASTLGLKNTYFINETGLDEDDIKSGAYGSAHDVSALFEYAITHHPELLAATKEPRGVYYSFSNQAHMGKNTNFLVDEIPGIIASKTGFTNTAGGNLVVAFDPEIGRPIIISILGSTERGRFEDVRALVSAVMFYINNSN